MLSLKELSAVEGLLPEATIDTVLDNGTIVPQHPAGVRNFVRFIARRFPSVRGQFVAPTKAMAPMAAQLKDGATDAEFNAIAGSAMGDMMGTLIEARADDGDEVDTAFIALTLCKPNSLVELKPYEAVVANMSEATRDVLLKGAQAATYGEDPEGFFGEVRSRMTKLESFEARNPTKG